MIISLGEGNDYGDGTGLKMFSRSGKSTTSQYLAFCNATKKQHTIPVDEADEFGSNEDLDQYVGEKKPSNIQDVMRKLADEERARNAKEKAEKKTMSGTHDKSKLSGFRPIDMLKDTQFRRQV
jgi:hypothetical protein